MAKISNSMILINIMLDEQLHTSKELEEKLQLKNSSIRWYMDELLVGGLEIETKRGKGGGYRLNRKISSNRICEFIEDCRKRM